MNQYYMYLDDTSQKKNDKLVNNSICVRYILQTKIFYTITSHCTYLSNHIKGTIMYKALKL